MRMYENYAYENYVHGTVNDFKFFPEKPYDLARSYKLAPYELAEHPCI